MDDNNNRPCNVPYLTLVIPCYNEERVIDETLAEVTTYLNDHFSSGDRSYEVIVVDDGSSDSTVSIAKSWAERFPNITVLENGVNRGKGYSVRSGILKGKGMYICFTDADLSTPLEEIENGLPYLEGLEGLEGGDYDIVIGSRSIEGSNVEVHQPWWRELMGKTFNLFVTALAVRGFKDTQCGFKIFKLEAADRIFSMQRLDGFSFDVEALFIATRFGFRIKEMPVKWINRFESSVNPILHPIQMFRDLIRIKIWNALGRYK